MVNADGSALNHCWSSDSTSLTKDRRLEMLSGTPQYLGLVSQGKMAETEGLAYRVSDTLPIIIAKLARWTGTCAAARKSMSSGNVMVLNLLV